MSYIIIILLLIYYSYTHDICKRVYNKELHLNFIFVIFFIFTGLRHGIGIDTYQFRIFWDLLPSFPCSWYELNVFRYDIGWVLLCFALKSIFGSFVSLQLIISLIFNLGLFKILKQYSKYPFLVLLLFFISGEQYFHIECTFLRQALSVGIFMYWGIDYLYSKNFIKYLVVVIVCSFFHFSSAFLIVFPFIWNLDISDSKVRNKIFISLISFVVGLFLLFNYSPFILYRAIERFDNAIAGIQTTDNEIIRFINSAHYGLFFIGLIFLNFIKLKKGISFPGAVVVLLFATFLGPYITDISRLIFFIIVFIDIMVTDLIVVFVRRNFLKMLSFLIMYAICTNLLIYSRYADSNLSFSLYPYYYWFEDEPISHRNYMRYRETDGVTIPLQIYDWRTK